MSFVRIWIHVVWATKYRTPFMVSDKRKLIIEHISSYAKSKGIYLDIINGYTDHLHCLISLGCDTSIAKVVQLLKGESAFWINKQRLFDDRFEWSTDYYAASVSESVLNTVRNYIRKQEEHHGGKTFSEEMGDFMTSPSASSRSSPD
jgi:putative transposase